MEFFVAGVDGCKAGWVWFKLYDSGRTEHGLVDLPAVLRERPDGLSALAIDIPIGLMDGPRTCDGAARRLLGSPRASSVFSAPCREALSAEGYFSACDANEARTGKRLSQQSWAIARKIKEVDDAISPSIQEWAFEVHPEVCFWHIAGKRAMAHGKKSSAGRSERIKVLSDYVPSIGEHVASKHKGVAADDLLDAAVAALSAQRWHEGKVSRVCKSQRDARGLRVEIVY
jgi:predicted RNase H-like nuclease